MQVSCTQCGAQYQFEASAIPPAGYDAQCTTCQAVFFVKPEGAPTLPEICTVSCTHCQAQYQFSAADIPAGGYDAQCTRCQKVFFVSATKSAPHNELSAPVTQAAETPPGEGVETIPDDIPELTSSHFKIQSGEYQLADVDMGRDKAPEPEAVKPAAETHKAFSPQVLGRGTMEIDLSAFPVESAPQPAAEQGDEVTATALNPPPDDEDFNLKTPTEAISFSAEEMQPAKPQKRSLQAPRLKEDPAPAAKAPTQPPQASFLRLSLTAVRRRKRFVAYAWASLVVCMSLAAVVYVTSPQLFFRTSRKVLALTRQVNPEVVALLAQSQQALLDDTDESYQIAVKNSEEAAHKDPEMAEAYAQMAMAYALRGADMQAQGGRIEVNVSRKTAALHLLQQSLRSHAGRAPQVDALKRELAEEVAAGERFTGNGARDVQVAEDVLARAEKNLGPSEALLQARAVCLAVSLPHDLQKLAAARQALERFDAHRAGVAAHGGPAAAGPSPWAEFARGMVQAASPSERQKAVRTLSASFKQEPRLLRARWALAQLLMTLGQKDEARRITHEILAAAPHHAKTRALQDSLNEPVVHRPAAAMAPGRAPGPAVRKHGMGQTKRRLPPVPKRPRVRRVR